MCKPTLLSRNTLVYGCVIGMLILMRTSPILLDKQRIYAQTHQLAQPNAAGQQPCGGETGIPCKDQEEKKPSGKGTKPAGGKGTKPSGVKPTPEPPCDPVAKEIRPLAFHKTIEGKFPTSAAGCLKENNQRKQFQDYEITLAMHEQIELQLTPYKLQKIVKDREGQMPERDLAEPALTIRLLGPHRTALNLQQREREFYHLGSAKPEAGKYTVRVVYETQLAAGRTISYALRVRKPLEFGQPVNANLHVVTANSKTPIGDGIFQVIDNYTFEVPETHLFTIKLRPQRVNDYIYPELLTASNIPIKLKKLAPDAWIIDAQQLEGLTAGKYTLRVILSSGINATLSNQADFSLTLERGEWLEADYQKRIQEIITTYYDRGKVDEAIERLEKMEQAVSNRPQASEYLGMIYYHDKNDQHKALDKMREAMRRGGSAIFKILYRDDLRQENGCGARNEGLKGYAKVRPNQLYLTRSLHTANVQPQQYGSIASFEYDKRRCSISFELGGSRKYFIFDTSNKSDTLPLLTGFLKGPLPSDRN